MPGSQPPKPNTGRYAHPATPAAAPRVLLVDHYDSFSWNLANQLVMAGLQLEILLQDDPALSKVAPRQYAGLVLSPGPGAPQHYPATRALLNRCPPELPLLGVCLGLQLLAEGQGAQIVRLPEPVHGKVHPLQHVGQGIFAGLANPLPVTRYHSLAVGAPWPEHLEPLAWTHEQAGEPTLQAFRVQGSSWWGLQFHPEAVLTQEGQQLVNHWAHMLGAAAVSQSGANTQ